MNASLSLVFSFRGRIGRGDYALIFAGLLVTNVLVRFLLIRSHLPPGVPLTNYYAVMKALPPTIALPFAAYSLVASWIGIAAQIKRVHDFGWSGWTIIAPVIAMFGVGLLCGLLGAFGNAAIAGFLLGLSIFAVALYYLALTGMMLFRKGGDGANAYDGDDATPRGGRLGGPDRAAAFNDAALAGGGHAQRNRVNDIMLTSYKAPQDRRSGFGRRGVA